MGIKVKIEELGNADEYLSQLDASVRGLALNKALMAAGRVVRDRYKPSVPRSSQTGTRDLWSENTRQTRDGVKPHAESIGVLVRQYSDAFVVVIGALYPAGALAHLLENDHRHVAWGHDTGETLTGTPYLEPAAVATEQQQTAELIRVLRSETGVED